MMRLSVFLENWMTRSMNRMIKLLDDLKIIRKERDPPIGRTEDDSWRLGD